MDKKESDKRFDDIANLMGPMSDLDKMKACLVLTAATIYNADSRFSTEEQLKIFVEIVTNDIAKLDRLMEEKPENLN